VPTGGRVVCKPNFIRHWNPAPGASVESVVTHGSVLRAALDYARLAVGPEGSLAIAEAPQHDCDFEAIRRIAGLDEISDCYAKELGCELEIVDLRREAVVYRDGVIVERRSLPGDPRGYRRSTSGSGAPSTARASTPSASEARTTTRAPPPSTTWRATTSTCSRRACSPQISW
jgi:hypothetical protein